MKIQAIFQKLRDHSDVISWNDSGHFVLEVSIIPNSNIVDLVNGIMHKKKGLILFRLGGATLAGFSLAVLKRLAVG